ncbi:IS5-like element ISSpu20 family transposase [Providencia huaxiensis]|uniref:IS5-like element ISSpu20 family transposase n=1 Tax=Providencia huashanensis TaxID=3037798 RepID=A0ABT9AVN0_9GAMM|nr:IS5-like element ISSpu20 family transposase [Providencia sp. CRE-138-0111]EKT9734995.1 IS5-like element ISSpu20 family transposase [Proteus mirabilis]EKW6744371.1 IS5-like element ISSpu20 family transposase [Proteus mirabilis]MBZ3683557.1 IS5-like element ISSpu20 family transposase [Providencia rettgeri]MDO7858730.1 IS5-like element ISSpu20 family transposase [Providencia sp. CRE-138-0111]
MPKPRYKTTNWKQYNQALINRGSLTFWIDEEAIATWKATTGPSKKGRPLVFSDLAITTALMVKRVFSMPLRALQGFINSVFKLANVPLVCPHYTCISKRAKTVNISFKTKTRGAIEHLAIDATGLKVYGEGEWKVKKHGTDGKRRVWRKLHIAVDTHTHEIIAAELSLSNVTDAEVLPNLLNQTYRKIHTISGDGAYDTRECHTVIRRKRAFSLIPPRDGAAYWKQGHPRNLAVSFQKLYGSNKKWKKRYGYHRRSISETAMHRIKLLLGGSLSMRNYNAQVGEAYAMIKALNKLTKLGMPETQYFV